MTSFLGALVLGYMALALQSTLVPHLGIAGVRPDLPLIVTVLLAYLRGPTAGTLAGFLIGLGQDFTNPSFLGLNALTGSLLGYVVGTLREHLDAATHPTRAGILFVSVLAHDLVYLTIYTRLALSEMLLGFLTRSLPSALYTALVGVGVFAVSMAFSRRGARTLGRSQLSRS